MIRLVDHGKQGHAALAIQIRSEGIPPLPQVPFALPVDLIIRALYAALADDVDPEVPEFVQAIIQRHGIGGAIRPGSLLRNLVQVAETLRICQKGLLVAFEIAQGADRREVVAEPLLLGVGREAGPDAGAVDLGVFPPEAGIVTRDEGTLIEGDILQRTPGSLGQDLEMESVAGTPAGKATFL